jgi:hypothetical protein
MVGGRQRFHRGPAHCGRTARGGRAAAGAPATIPPADRACAPCPVTAGYLSENRTFWARAAGRKSAKKIRHKAFDSREGRIYKPGSRRGGHPGQATVLGQVSKPRRDAWAAAGFGESGAPDAPGAIGCRFGHWLSGRWRRVGPAGEGRGRKVRLSWTRIRKDRPMARRRRRRARVRGTAHRARVWGVGAVGHATMRPARGGCGLPGRAFARAGGDRGGPRGGAAVGLSSPPGFRRQHP